MSRNLNAIVSDSGHQYLIARGFQAQSGSYYYPETQYPHLHVGLRSEVAFTDTVTVEWVDERFGTVRSRTGEQTYAYQTLDFMSYHLAGQSRARHIWSASSGWAADASAIAADLQTAGLFPMCQIVLNAFAVTRDSAPDALAIRRQ